MKTIADPAPDCPGLTLTGIAFTEIDVVEPVRGSPIEAEFSKRWLSIEVQD